MNIYRMAIGNNYDKATPTRKLLTDEEISGNHNLLCPLTIIRCARLSFLVRIAREWRTAIIILIQINSHFHSGWCSNVMQDIHWLNVDESVLKVKRECLIANVRYWHELGGIVVEKFVKKHCQVS